MIRIATFVSAVLLAVTAAQAQDFGRPIYPVLPYAYVTNNSSQEVRVAVASAVGTFSATMQPGHMIRFPFDPNGGDRTMSVFSVRQRTLLSARQVILMPNHVYDAVPGMPAPVAEPSAPAPGAKPEATDKKPTSPFNTPPDRGRELKSNPDPAKVRTVGP